MARRNLDSGRRETHDDFTAMFQLFGKPHFLSILWELYRRTSPVTFSELRETTGINPVTLSKRLKALEAEGFVVRHPLHVMPRRVEYTVTPMTRASGPVWRELTIWRKAFPRPSRERRQRPPRGA